MGAGWGRSGDWIPPPEESCFLFCGKGVTFLCPVEGFKEMVKILCTMLGPRWPLSLQELHPQVSCPARGTPGLEWGGGPGGSVLLPSA